MAIGGGGRTAMRPYHWTAIGLPGVFWRAEIVARYTRILGGIRFGIASVMG